MTVPSDTPEGQSETGLYGDLTASHPNPGPKRGEGGASGAQAGAGGSGWSHVYLATACLHGRHDYCQGRTGAAGPKQPAVCKFCAAPCTCQCHRSSGTPQQADPASAQVDRWHRREQLPVLLSRMQRGRLLDSERGLLRAAVERELADAEQAWAEVADWQHNVAQRAFTAPDADLDTVLASLDARIRDTVDERDRARRIAVELEQQLAAVAALHTHNTDADYCDLCANHGDIQWPCATIRALNPPEDTPCPNASTR